MPRQILGPLENAFTYLLRVLDPGSSQRSGMKSCGEGKRVGSRWVK